MRPAPPRTGSPPRPAPLDRETLEGVRERKPQALAALFERHVDGIFDLACRLLGDRAAAEDATQEVFLRVWRGAATLDASRDPRPWLMKITRNACRDVWRSASWKLAQRTRSLDAGPDDADRAPEPAAPGEDPEAGALAAERRRLVQSAVLELPEPQREVVVLHLWSGLSHDEIAGIVDASHAAVRKRYSRAVAALGEKLERWFP